MAMQTITEGSTTFITDSDEKITKRMPVFYNPVMKLNRDLSLLVLATMDGPRIGLPMEASGVRAARIEQELITTGLLRPRSLMVNDINPRAIEIAKRNVQNAVFSVEDASVFLRKNRPLDYIDIDPFGTPNPFLDAACQALRNGGVLAVTATDTAALTGTYPLTTQRKYWAIPSRTWAMHEFGLRILIRKVQLIGMQYGKALVPTLSVYADHYYRIFLTLHGGPGQVKRILGQHGTISVDGLAIKEGGCTGPMWLGRLHDVSLVKQLVKLPLEFEKAKRLLAIIMDECSLDTIGFQDMHVLAKHFRKEPPRREELLQRLGRNACRTHISPTGFKTTLSPEELLPYWTFRVPHAPK